MRNEFTVEKQWVTECGLQLVIIMTGMGHRCGYVGVDKDNYLFGRDYFEIEHDINVHGGITYSGNADGEYPVKSDLWWFGFDTAHLNDDPSIGGQPLEYCVDQCESLAKQLKQLMEKQNDTTKN